MQRHFYKTNDYVNSFNIIFKSIDIFWDTLPVPVPFNYYSIFLVALWNQAVANLLIKYINTTKNTSLLSNEIIISKVSLEVLSK